MDNLAEEQAPAPSPARPLPKINDQTGLLGSGSYGAIYIAKMNDPEPRDVAVKFCTYDSPEGSRNPVTHLLREISVLHYMQQMGRRVAGERAPTVELIDMRVISATELPAALPQNLRNRGRCVVLVMTLYDHDFAGLRKAGAFGPLTFSQLVFCWRSLTAALASLHKVGVVHRDIKASNILLDDMGCCHLADLGMARVDFAAMLPKPPSSASLSATTAVATASAAIPPAPISSRESRSKPKQNEPQAELLYGTLRHSIEIDVLASGPTGTLLYRPPEQLFGLVLPQGEGGPPFRAGQPHFLGDSSGDVYSLSLVVLEVLIERFVFTVRAGHKGYNTALMMLAQLELYGSDLVEMVTEVLDVGRESAEDMLISAFLAARARGMTPDTAEEGPMEETARSLALETVAALPDPKTQRYIKVGQRDAFPPVEPKKVSQFVQSHRAIVRYPSRLQSMDPVEIGGEAIRELLRKPPAPILEIIRGAFVARLGRAVVSPTYSTHLEAFCSTLASALSCVPSRRPTAAQLAGCSIFQAETSSLAAALPEARTLDRLVACPTIEEEYSCRGCTRDKETALSQGILSLLTERAGLDRSRGPGRGPDQRPIPQVTEQARQAALNQRRRIPGRELIASCSAPWSSFFRIAEEYGIMCQTPLTPKATAEQLIIPLAERMEAALEAAIHTWKADRPTAGPKKSTDAGSPVHRQPHLKR